MEGSLIERKPVSERAPREPTVPASLRRSLRREPLAASAAVAATLVAVALVVDPRLAGLAGLALAAGVVAYLRPSLLPAMVALALPAGHATETLGVQVAPLDAVAGGGAIGYLILAARTPSMRVMGLPHWLYVVFLGCVALSTLGPADDGERLRTVLVLGALGVVFHALTTRLGNARARRALFVALAAAVLFEAVLALYEYVNRWSDRFAERDGAIVYPLPQGTLTHPNALAQFLVLGSLVVAALAFSEKGLPRRLGLAVAGLAAVALLVTFSRGSWIAFSGGVAVYALDRRLRRRVLVAGGAVLIACAVLAVTNSGAIGARISSLFDRDTSTLSNFRVEVAKHGARIAAEHPLTGTGVFRDVGVYAGRPTIATHPHNLFIGIAVFFGIPATVAFAAIVAAAFRRAWRRFRAGSLTALGCLAALVALLVNGLFEYPFWSESLTALVVVVLGTALGVTTIPVSRGTTRHPSFEG